MAVNAFFGDWELMPKLEQIERLTFFRLLDVDGVFCVSIYWIKLEANLWCLNDGFFLHFRLKNKKTTVAYLKLLYSK